MQFQSHNASSNLHSCHVWSTKWVQVGVRWGWGQIGLGPVSKHVLILQAIKAGGSCPFMKAKAKAKNNFKEAILAQPVDVEEVGKQGRRKGVCPYYTARSAVPEAQLVLLPYSALLAQVSETWAWAYRSWLGRYLHPLSAYDSTRRVGPLRAWIIQGCSCDMTAECRCPVVDILGCFPTCLSAIIYQRTASSL